MVLDPRVESGGAWLVTKSLWIGPALIVSGLVMIFAQRGVQRPGSHSYSAAFIKEKTLVVFPFDADEVTIPLPIKVGAFTYTPDGKSVYSNAPSFVDRTASGLLKVEIKPTRLSAVPGSLGFGVVYSVAISARQDKAVISGRYRQADADACGVFELNFASDVVRKVIANDDGGCDYLSAWTAISLSPDGSHAVARERRGEIGLIDINAGKVQAQWPGTTAAWSPDGKWIATVDFTEQLGIALIDPNNVFGKRRGLGHTDIPTIAWSPDSRYLLLWKSEAQCAPYLGYFGTFEALEVSSGLRTPIKSSRCKVNLMTGGWISNEVLK